MPSWLLHPTGAPPRLLSADVSALTSMRRVSRPRIGRSAHGARVTTEQSRRFVTTCPAAAFAGLAESSDVFDIWFRERVLELTGVDLAAPSDDPLPEIILDWNS
jgi:hypothetical protein